MDSESEIIDFSWKLISTIFGSSISDFLLGDGENEKSIDGDSQKVGEE